MKRKIYNKARRYYPSTGSHGWNHINDVLRRARRYIKRPLTDDEYAAILYHDSSLASSNRDSHHIDSAEIAQRDLADIFRRRRLDNIKLAILEHRASYTGEFSSPISELLSSADRGEPDINDLLNRAIAYRKELGKDDDDAVRGAIKHIKLKYGRSGYQRAPKMYYDNNRDKLDKFYDDVDRL